MKFKPRTQEELLFETAAMSLITPGIYSFEVIEATNKFSKAGNEMIELKLKVWDDNGRERIIFDYLLESMAHKLRHFCEATDLLSKYEMGVIDDMDCVGKSGLVDLIIQKGTQKLDGSYYSDRNSVKDYLIKEGFNKPSTPKLSIASNGDIIDDDIPF